MSVQSEVLAALSEILGRADLGGIAYCDLTSTVKTIRFNCGLQVVFSYQRQNTVTFPLAFYNTYYAAAVSFWSGNNHEGYASEYCFQDKKTTSINVKGTGNGGLYRDLICIGRWK